MEKEKPAHILICDDETGIRQSLKLILDRIYQLSYASHGRDVVEFLKQNRKTPPDLLIMDIKMPHLNGLDALRQIRRINRKIRVLIITGYESSDVAAEAIRFGANDYLTKPFDRETVQEKVRSLLSPPVRR